MSVRWTPPPRSAEAQALYHAAETDRAAHPERYALDPDLLAAGVLAKHGLEVDDDGDWREGFAVYVASAREEGRLNALGARTMVGTALGKLQARFAIAAALARQPEIRARAIDRPIFVIGGWRTGTTLLQRLLAALPGLRALHPAELTAPWLFAGLDAAARSARIDAGAAAHARLHLLNPAMARVHPSGAQLAEECVLAMGTDFRNWGFPSTLRCPRYAAWLLGQDFAGSYRRYADVLRLLQDGSGARFVLKAPAHTAELPSLFAAFPDARVVQLHRDVVETVTSGASLFAMFRSTYSDEVDPVEVGRYQLETTATWFERAMDARDAHPSAAVLDLAYAELVADPVACARRICRAFEVDWSEASRAAAQARLVELRQRHGSHRYTPEQFGLDPDEIRARFARYRGRYGVP
jgi:LPS sulfotransferase NodH